MAIILPNHGEHPLVSYRIELTNVSMDFGSTRALQKVSLSIPRGRIRGLVGENGAGKSTLSKIIAGDIRPTSGALKVNGQEVPYLTPASAWQAGIAIVHQWGDLVRDMTVEENIFLGNEIRGPFRILKKAEMRRKAKSVLARLGIAIDTQAKVSALTPAHKQIVAISKALMKQCDFLIVDEGGVSLDKKETELLHAVLRQLRDQQVTIVYISHLLDDVVKLSDEITVMRNGANVVTLDARKTTAEELAVAVVGHEINPGKPENSKKDPYVCKTLLKVSDLTWDDSVPGFSLVVHEGDIIGITGPEGAGKSELLRTIFGLLPARRGNVFFDGEQVEHRTPQKMLAHGIAFVPEDRFEEGVLLNRSIEENVSLPGLCLQKGFFTNEEKLRAESERKTRQIRTKMASIQSAVRDLSGGNQQKVVISRWLEDFYRLLLLDEPYKGIDIGAKADINEEIRKLAGRGRGVVVISTEFAELVGLVTKLFVVVNRRIVATLVGEQITAQQIVRHYQYDIDASRPSTQEVVDV